jgi:hypothetical protein
MPLVSEQSKMTIGFGAAGLLVAVVCGIYAALVDYTTPTDGFGLLIALISMIACPPQLLFALCIDCEVIGWGGLVMYSIIGVLNVVLYSAIGFIVGTLRNHSRPTGSAI